MRLIFIILLSCSHFLLFAQHNEKHIQGRIFDLNHVPVEYATVSLLSIPDSSLIEGDVSDSTGSYTLKKELNSGNYLLRISHIGYKTLFIPMASSDYSSAHIILLEPLSVELQEISVKGNFVERKFDRFIVHMKGNTLVQGKNVNEVLGLMPGVTNINGKLLINGENIAEIYIDKRRVEDPNELINIQAINIENVQILPDVRLKHDATMKGGVIYITLKNVTEGGGYGSISSNYEFRGKGNNSENFGFPFNFRGKKINLYNNISANLYNNLTKTETLNKNIFLDSEINSLINSENESKLIRDIFSLVYDINQNQNLGINLMIRKEKSNLRTTSISDIVSDNESYNSSYENLGTQEAFKYQTCVSYDYKTDGKVKNVHAVVDFLRHEDDRNETSKDTVCQYNLFKDRSSLLKSKVDLLLTLKENMDLSFLFDYYYNHTSNDRQYADWISNDWEVDSNRSGVYRYKGMGYGGYVDYVWKIDNLTLNGGVRLQNDLVRSYSGSDKIDRDYLNLFPNIRLSYVFNNAKRNRLTLSYSKYMDEIRYRDMNPAIIYNSDFSYAKGNPNLIPSIENRIKLEFSFLNQWNFNYTYSIVTDKIYSMTYTDESNPLITYTMPTNVGKSEGHSCFIGFNKRFSKLYFVNASFSGSYRNEKGLDFTNHLLRGLFICHNNFEFTKSFGATCFFMFEPKYRTVETTYHSVYTLHLKLYKNFFDNKLNVNLQLYNLLNKNRVLTTNTNDNNYQIIEKNVTPYRGFMLSLVYNFNFGNKVKVKKTSPIQSMQELNLKK